MNGRATEKRMTVFQAALEAVGGLSNHIYLFFLKNHSCIEILCSKASLGCFVMKSLPPSDA